PTRWRELAKPLDVEGKLWVDAGSGVIVRSELAGRFEVADRDVRPTQVRFNFRSTLDHVGTLAEIVRPQHTVPEYKPTPPPYEELTFFKDQLPRPDDAAGGTQPATP